MIFERTLARQVMEGKKTVTRRVCSDNPRSPWWREKCALVAGKVVTVNPGRGVLNIGRIEVVDVSKTTLRELEMRSVAWAEAEVEREGFVGFLEFREAWEAINGVWDLDAALWRVEFKVAAAAPAVGAAYA